MIQNPQGNAADVLLSELGVCEFLQLDWITPNITTSYGVTQMAKKLIVLDNPNAVLYQSPSSSAFDAVWQTSYKSGWFTVLSLGYPTFDTTSIIAILGGGAVINPCQIIYYLNNFYVADLPNPVNPPLDAGFNVNAGWRVAGYDDFIKSLGLIQQGTIQGVWGTQEYLSLCHAWSCMNDKLLEEACNDNCNEFCRIPTYEKIHHKILAAIISFNNHQFSQADTFIEQVYTLCNLADCGC